jgi:hypothetical protein
MPKGRFDISDYAGENGNSAFGREHPRGLDLKPDIPLSGNGVTGIDLTHIIHTTEVAAAKPGGGGGGPGGGGGGGGGGGTTFAPYTSGDPGGFNITIEFKGSWTQDLYNIFVSSAERLSDLIIGDIPNVTVTGKGGQKLVDDILITAELGNIDGLNGILGQAGPTAVRTGSSLPATATMKFDIVDVNAMGLAVFAEVVLHEMSHSLGFGSIWSRLGLVTDGLFTGSHALGEYLDLGGSGNGIPVEQDGGSGTAGSHWNEETFANELMTGYINNGDNPYSAMSAASFADLGYTISNPTIWADGYVLPA